MQFSVFQLEIKRIRPQFSNQCPVPISTCGPWKCSGGQADEDLDEVIDDPGNDHVVVEADPYHDEKHGVSNSWGKYLPSQGINRDKSTLEQRNDAPEGNGTAAGILPEGEFEKEERQAGEDKVCEVRDEERSCGGEYLLT